MLVAARHGGRRNSDEGQFVKHRVSAWTAGMIVRLRGGLLIWFLDDKRVRLPGRRKRHRHAPPRKRSQHKSGNASLHHFLSR